MRGYRFYYEGDLNPFADFEAEGSFADRTYTFKAGMGEVIARVKRAPEVFRDVDGYQVDVAAGVDGAEQGGGARRRLRVGRAAGRAVGGQRCWRGIGGAVL